MKRALWIVLGIAGVLFLAGFAAKRYLSSRSVANKVVAQLETLYGGGVKVAEVDIGLSGTTITGFELYEKNDPTTGTPWLSVEGLNTDLSLFDLLGDNPTPTRVKLKGAKVLLRFNREGTLITALPDKLFQGTEQPKETKVGDVPEIELERSQVILRKEGFEDLIFQNINAKVDKKANQLVLSGGTENPRWGKWAINSQFSPDSNVIAAELKSHGPVRVTQAMLNQIPFVPPSVWKEVQILEGDTPGLLHLSYDLKKQHIQYNIDLSPVQTTLVLPTLELKATKASGKILIKDSVVTLRDIEGEVFAGSLRLEANLDFQTDTTRMDFTSVEARRLDVSQFPPSWKFPRQIKGKLVGKASLQVVIPPSTYDPSTVGVLVSTLGMPLQPNPLRLATVALASPTESRIQTSGKGKGEIVEASIGKLGGKVRELSIELQPVPGGFEFALPSQNTRDEGSIPLPGNIHPRNLGPLVHSIAPLLTGAQEKKEPAAKPKSTGLEINLKMDDVDLSKFEEELNVKLPYPLAGKVSFEVKLAIPLDDSQDLKKYRLHGNAQVKDFVLSDLKLEYLEGEINFNEGVLRMPKLKGRLADPANKDPLAGTFQGTGSLQVEPLGELKVEVSLDRIPLNQVAKILAIEDPVQGDFSGVLSASASGKDPKNTALWKASAKINSQRIEAFGLTLQKTAGQLELEKNALRIVDLQTLLEGAPIQAGGMVQIDEPYPFQAKVNLQKVDLAALQRLAPGVRPPVALAGNFLTQVDVKGTLSPLKYQASGDVQASDLKIETFTMQKASFRWELDTDRLLIKNLQALLYEGEAAGSAIVPLRHDVAGMVDVQVKSVDAGPLTKDVPGMPVKVQGKVDGQFKGTLPKVEEGKERQMQVQLDLKAPKLRVQNIPAEQLSGKVDYQKGILDYRLVGKTLGGTFELEGQVPSTEEKKVKKGQLQIQGIEIGRLLAALNFGKAAEALTGRLSLDLDFTHTTLDSWPAGSGRVRLSNVRYKDAFQVQNIQGDLFLTGRQLRLRDFSFNLGQGIVRAQVGLNLQRLDLSWFTVNMDNVDAEKLLDPWVGSIVKGLVQARIRGKLGNEWTGSADLELGRGEVMGLEVTQWRIPVTFRYAPAEGRGQVDITDMGAQVGRGRATGKISLGWDYTARAEGQLIFSRVDLQTFLRQTVGSTQIGGGMMTGKFDFAGRDMRGIEDLSGILVASFEQTQALRTPVLKEAAPFLGIGPNTTFQKGDLRGRLDRGIFRIQRLALESSNYNVFIEGTVTLAGRLNLDVQANTGTFGIGTPRLRLLGLRIPITGPVPLVVAQEAATLLSNRVIHLRVTGTLRSPNIRVLPLATLTQEGIRYFLTRAINPLPVSP